MWFLLLLPIWRIKNQTLVHLFSSSYSGANDKITNTRFLQKPKLSSIYFFPSHLQERIISNTKCSSSPRLDDESKQPSFNELPMDELLTFLGIRNSNQQHQQQPSALVNHVFGLLTQCLDQLNATKDKIPVFNAGITDESFEV